MLQHEFIEKHNMKCMQRDKGKRRVWAWAVTCVLSKKLYFYDHMIDVRADKCFLFVLMTFLVHFRTN